jgi:hypothetical protein
MKRNRKANLKLMVSFSLALFVVILSINVTAQREAKRGRNGVHTNWGGSSRLRETALHTGYDSGLNDGRNDRSRGERFDFKDESAYKIATKGYTSSLGDVTLYQRYFRAGFENGYIDGWNGY